MARPRLIGAGAFADVYLSVEDGSERVDKRVRLERLNEDEKEAVIKEVKIMMDLNHPNIVVILGYQYGKDLLHIYMEYLAGGDLARLLKEYKSAGKDFDEPTVVQYLSQLLSALARIHAHGLMHRDLKPQNILLSQDRRTLKIADFGVSATFGSMASRLHNSVAGTPGYIAPEVYDEEYDHKCDVWSLGVIAYELVHLRPAFVAKTEAGLMKKVIDCKPDPVSTRVTKGLRDAITEMLQKQSKARPECSQLLSRSLFDKEKNIQQLRMSMMLQRPSSSSTVKMRETATVRPSTLTTREELPVVPSRSNDERMIGEGRFGVNFLCRDRNMRLFVDRRVSVCDIDNIEEYENLVKLLTTFRHLHVVAYYGHRTDREFFHISMEYMAGGNLENLIQEHQSYEQPFPESDIVWLTAQMLSAVAYIHSEFIVHHLLRPSGVLFTPDKRALKIDVDFICNVRSGPASSKPTPIGYCAPESIHAATRSNETNVWSLGVMVYEIVHLRLPFAASNAPATALKIMAGKYEPVSERVSFGLRNLITDMLQLDRSKRPGCQQLLCRPLFDKLIGINQLRGKT